MTPLNTFFIVILKKGGVIMENKEKELEVEIKGYGCDDDCEQYFEKTFLPQWPSIISFFPATIF